MCIGFVGAMFYAFHISDTPITDIEIYSDFISGCKKAYPHIAAHFPNEIPAEAKNAEFYYRQGFLQGDSMLNLKFQTSPEVINAYYDQFKQDATKTVNINYYCELSGDFEKLYFQEDPNNTPEHSPTYGVVIDKEQCIIVFWATCI